jgi:hypothetical protein
LQHLPEGGALAQLMRHQKFGGRKAQQFLAHFGPAQLRFISRQGCLISALRRTYDAVRTV